MSMSRFSTYNVRTAAQEANRQWWASSLARYTAARRQELGLTIAQAADLAGLELSEWAGIEEGWVPDEILTLRAVAGVLEVRWTDYNTLAFLAGCHLWG